MLKLLNHLCQPQNNIKRPFVSHSQGQITAVLNSWCFLLQHLI